MQTEPLHIFIISDSIGETAAKFCKAALVQFPNLSTVLHKSMFISNKEALDEILVEASQHNSIVLLTLADTALANHAEEYCLLHNITPFNLIQPLTQEITNRTGVEATHQIGAQHDLSSEYFKRVQAMEFCMTFDDGKDPSGFEEADIVLLGISRTSKTPLSMYLGNLGYKVANLPLIPENDLPDIIFKIDPKKIVGLTTSPQVGNKHREIRMKEYGIPQGSRYASVERVNQELAFANELFDRLGCFVINTSDRSIEETASIILDKLGLSVYTV